MTPIHPIPRIAKMTETPQLREDDDISILELLQTIAENLRLLVISPIVVGLVGLVALAGASLWRTTYESSFTVNTSKKRIESQQISSLAVAAQTLNGSAKTLQAADQFELGQSQLADAASSNILRICCKPTQTPFGAKSSNAWA